MKKESVKITSYIIIACMISMLTISYISKNSHKTAETIKTTDEPTIKYFEEDPKDIANEIISEPPSEPTFYLSDYERWIAECVVMGEAGAESYEGQVLVAQCLLNGCIKEEVQPSVLRKEYKYSGWKEDPTDSVKKAVSAVFDDGYKITDEFILYFYAPRNAKGKWHETQRFVIEEGNHRFFAGWTD